METTNGSKNDIITPRKNSVDHAEYLRFGILGEGSVDHPEYLRFGILGGDSVLRSFYVKRLLFQMEQISLTLNYEVEDEFPFDDVDEPLELKLIMLKLFMKTVLCFFKLEPLEPHEAFLKTFSASNRRLKATGDEF